MAEASAYARTKVRTTNPEQGVYQTLNGQFQIRKAAKKGQWDLYKREGETWVLLQADAGKYDAALTRILAEPGVTLDALNTAPPKPQPPKPEAKPEAQATVELTKADRRSGATGTAPAKPKSGRPHVNRGGRKVA